MRIAVEGCTHGELENIYSTIQEIEKREGYKVDLLICCGDFQSTRNLSDLKCMACPDKYKEMCSFYKYFAGEAIAPMLTIFIGGNHEASNYLQELAYGGWVAPNIYYLGYAGVVQVNGIRIGGMSGIYKGFDYLHGHYERPPYDDRTIRSCYHIRNVDIFRLKQLADCSPDIMLSHDWPQSITDHGDVEQLLRFKKFLREDVEQDKLGSGPAKEVLEILKPSYWFSGHLHCKFAALVEHEDGKATKFLALDKCLPGRQFLQVLELGEPVKDDELSLKYDKHWLAVLRNTNHLISVERKNRYTPGPGCKERYDFRPTKQELEEIEKLFNNDFDIPYNFEQSALAFKPTGGRINMGQVSQPQATTNKQTTELCTKLGIFDPMALLIGTSQPLNNRPQENNPYNYVNESEASLATTNPDEITFLMDDSVEDEEEEGAEEMEKGEEEEKKSFRLPMSIPAPTLDSDDVDLVPLLNTSQNSSGLFVIDTTGSSSCSTDDKPGCVSTPIKEGEMAPPENAPPPSSTSSSPPLVKKLKRRNASLYTSQ